MSKFVHRSQQLEMMDFPVEEDGAIFKNFDELVFINTYLGGPAHSLAKINALVRDVPQPVIADIGFGAGDFLSQALRKWPNADLIGVDSMPQAVEYAQQRYADMASQTELVCADYKHWISESEPVDVIHAALFCHHLDDEQLLEFLRSASSHVRSAVVINDLHRHPLAYHSIRWLTRLFSKSAYTRNDAPLSVLRGFKAREWEQFLHRAGLRNFRIQWKWAFRHVITIYPS